MTETAPRGSMEKYEDRLAWRLAKLAGTDLRRLVAGEEEPTVLATKKDRAALAALRRGLGKPPGTVPAMYPIVASWNPPPYAEETTYLVAALFGAHPVSACDKRPLTAAIARTQRSESYHKRVMAMLDADRADLHVHLRHAIAHLAGQQTKIGVDWAQLFLDVLRWDDPRRYVQRRWAHAYWGGGDRAADDESEDAESSLDDVE